MFARPILAALVVAMLAGLPATAAVHAADHLHPVAAASRAPGFKPTEPQVHVKFREGTDVRLRAGRLVSLRGDDTSAVGAALGKHPILGVEPLFVGSEAELTSKRAAAERRSGNKLADFNLWYRIRTSDETDRDSLVEALRALSIVEAADVVSLAAPPTTPNLSGSQGYRLAAPDGVNASAASSLPGGSGDRVKIIDLEYDWNASHEDLGHVTMIPNGTLTDPYGERHHGTATVGVMLAAANGIGVTGIAPGARGAFINVHNKERGPDVQNAITMAVDQMSPGDVLLVELQAWDLHPEELVPLEYFPAYFDAIKYATSRGIIVIEPAGNGTNDLDMLNIGAQDSGAIMVGAGNAPNCDFDLARSRAWFSNYGSRVDVQGWGECVASTGYGDLYNGGPNALYTDTYAGTSSASPMVAGTAALLSSVIEARSGAPATPTYIRSLLKSTGTPQATGEGTIPGHIGPLPDVARAVEAITAPDVQGPYVGGPYQAPTVNRSLLTTGQVPTTISWSGTDRSGVTSYAVKMSTNGGAWTTVRTASPTARSVVVNLVPGTRYQFRVAAKDGVGNWSTWKNGAAFAASRLAETSSTIGWSPYGWTRTAYGSALGGYVKTSGQENAWATFTFSGRGVAWVGTKAATRGQADIWIDGVYQKRVDLYSATTYARRIVFSKSVSPNEFHQLHIQVVGTANRPKVDVDAFVVLK